MSHNKLFNEPKFEVWPQRVRCEDQNKVLTTENVKGYRQSNGPAVTGKTWLRFVFGSEKSRFWYCLQEDIRYMWGVVAACPHWFPRCRCDNVSPVAT